MKVRFIINPSSGRQSFQKFIDDVSLGLLDKGFEVSRFYTKGAEDALEETLRLCSSDIDYIVACGGDGTVNEVANGIGHSECKKPLAIIPSGTVNDFSTIIDMPKSVEAYVDMIQAGKTKQVDMGLCGDKYFVNVAAGGFLTGVAHQVSTESKTALGRTAYYVHGLREFLVDGIKPKRIKCTSEEYVGEDEAILFLISNTSSIGGFKKLAPLAEIEDGLLDVLIIRKTDMANVVSIFLSLSTGKHINNKDVVYFKTKNVLLESFEDIEVDMDGDFGGMLPMRFKVAEKALTIFTK